MTDDTRTLSVLSETECWDLLATAALGRLVISVEKGFCAVAAEADWPDAYRVNRCVRGQGHDASADEALSGSERFPAWMWRNTVVRDFVGWLRAHNAQRRDENSGEAGYAQQNVQTVRDAEVYYRAMFGGRVTSWNLRDRHMAHTLEALKTYLDRHGGSQPARIVVWANNSHVGDARATEVGDDGRLTLGQRARERFGEHARLIGFTTYTGTVTAASEWGGVAERKVVRPALNGSVEELFHEVDRPAFPISPAISRAAAEPLDAVRLGRAIGVVYQPATERQSHYYRVRPGEQFDGIIHIDKTTALEPLEVTSGCAHGETPETYRTGL